MMTQQILWALVGQTAVIVAGALAVIAYNNARFNAIDKRFDDLKDWIRSEVKRLDERIERLEHPITPSR
jgi:ubiquinone biosynthesis protein UbiJ